MLYGHYHNFIPQKYSTVLILFLFLFLFIHKQRLGELTCRVRQPNLSSLRFQIQHSLTPLQSFILQREKKSQEKVVNCGMANRVEYT